MKPKSNSGKYMQNVRFDSVEELLEFLPETELKLTEFLRRLVFECVPDAQEKLSYNVPFYRRNAGILFIWPGSVSWGKVQHPGVRFGFQQGYLLQDNTGYLDRGGRKQVYWKDFLTVQDIDLELLRAYIYEAVMVDDGQRKRKKS